jgi:hypothetical protein
MKHTSHANRAMSGAAGAWDGRVTRSWMTSTTGAKRDGRQSKVACCCCRPWSMRMVPTGGLT